MSVTPVVNLIIEKGTNFEASFYLAGEDGEMLNLNGTTAEAKLKKYPTSPKSYSFNVGITTSDGEISISMGRTMTATLPSGRSYYDVFTTNSLVNITTRVVTGTIMVEDTTI